jgi:hypothetical protein
LTVGQQRGSGSFEDSKGQNAGKASWKAETLNPFIKWNSNPIA